MTHANSKGNATKRELRGGGPTAPPPSLGGPERNGAPQSQGRIPASGVRLWAMDDECPSRVRERVLEQHRHLRRLLDDLREATRKATLGSGADSRILVAKTVDVLTFLRGHLEMEDRHLMPLIEKADAWGPVRRQAMEEEHRAQRARFDELQGLVSRAHGDSRVPLLVAEFIAELLVDMAREEREMLRDDLLRDDTVNVDQNDG